jgi:hypothetical protein
MMMEEKHVKVEKVWFIQETRGLVLAWGIIMGSPYRFLGFICKIMEFMMEKLFPNCFP